MKQKTNYKCIVDNWANKHNAQIIAYPELKQRGAKGYFIAMSGEYAGLGFVKTLDAILQGTGIEYRSLTTDSKESYLHRLVSPEGYEILEFPMGYRTDRHMTLQVPFSKEVWQVKPTNFKLGRRPRGIRNASLGELLIQCILDYNQIDYKTEVTVKIQGSLHRFDFQLSDKSFIEYQGEQHYHEVAFSNKNVCSLAERQERDSLKKRYCTEQKAVLIEVKYPATLDNIFSQLHKYLPLNRPSDKFLSNFLELNANKIKLVAEYYKTHSGEDTSKKFNVSRKYVIGCYKLIYGEIKGKQTVSANQRKIKKAKDDFTTQIDKYFLTHTATETAKLFGVSPESVRVGFYRRNKMSKRQYIREKFIVTMENGKILKA